MGEVIPVGEHGSHIEIAGHRSRDAGHRPGRGQDLEGTQEGLARHACPIGAFAAHQLGLHDDRGPVAALDGVLGDVLSRRPTADDYDIPPVASFIGHAPTLTAPGPSHL